jgi:hypothetical protein
MTKLDDETLLAFADGELDPRQAAQVAVLLADDPAARETLRIFQESAALVRGAFDQTLHEPIPERLLKTINETRIDSTVSDLRLAQPTSAAKQKKRLLSAPPVWAAAASVALVVGLAGGYTVFRVTSAPHFGEPSASLLVNDGLLSQALETTLSGSVFSHQDTVLGGRREITPLLTFQDENRRFCREYEEIMTSQDTRRAMVGVACRNSDGSWHPEAVMARHIVAPTLRGGGSSQDSYVPAAGADIAPFDLVIDALMTRGPLAPAEEQQLLQEGWRGNTMSEAKTP